MSCDKVVETRHWPWQTDGPAGALTPPHRQYKKLGGISTDLMVSCEAQRNPSLEGKRSSAVNLQRSEYRHQILPTRMISHPGRIIVRLWPESRSFQISLSNSPILTPLNTSGFFRKAHTPRAQLRMTTSSLASPTTTQILAFCEIENHVATLRGR